MWRIALVFALIGCGDKGNPDRDSGTDIDGDGFTGADDCDEGNAAINPSATDQVGDDIDQNCDGIDGTDLDLDGHASELSGGSDCDDHDASIHVDATEIPYDDVDQDCDGQDLGDVDGDGQDAEVAGGADCDDDDPSVFDGAEEVPYDGIDQDCDGADLIDVDGDGFDWDQAGGDDCDDDDPDAYPGAMEQAHDGVDQDCDGVDLLDNDGDGFDWDQAGGDDCHDGDVNIFPGAPEVPYDGIDQDCNGADVTDVDGDGVDAILAGGLDCDDGDNTVFPGALDVCYDGIDANCDGLSDYDCDQDGVDSDAWGGNDCDDFDPLIGAGGIEILGDGVDQDCGNDGDAARFTFGGYSWDNPRPPRLAATTDHYILVTSADELDLGVAQPVLVGVALAFDRTSGTNATPIGTPALWQGATNPQPLGNAVDVVAVGDVFWAATAYTHSATNWTYLVAREVEWEQVQSAYIMRTLEYAGTNIAYDSLAVDLVLDTNEEPWATSCGVDTLHTLKGIGVIPAPFDALGPGPVLPAGVPGGACFWHTKPDPGILDIGDTVLCETGFNCTNYDFDPVLETLTVGALQPWGGVALESGNFREGWVNAVDSNADAWVFGPAAHEIFSGHNVLYMDAHWYGPELYAVAVVDDNGPELILSYGDPAVSMTEVALDISDPARPGLVVTGAAVHADVDRLVIAFSADNPVDPTDDAIGWAFYGWP